MLQLSENAATALEEARSAQDVPEGYGVRIAAQPGPDGQMGIALGFVEQPLEGDEVTEQSGTELYIAPEVAEPLADSMLDVESGDQGQELVIKPQDAQAS